MIKLNDSKVIINHFPDGTQRLNLDRIYETDNDIKWFYEKEEELSTLIYITRHLRNLPHTGKINLYMYYLPNARMDRIHRESEVFTLKGFSDVINWLNFDYVEILDVHSNVGSALINNTTILTPEEYINNVIEQIKDNIVENNKNVNSELILYFPDEGASKKYSHMFPKYKYCYGEKKRDWDTGKILGLDIRSNGIDLNGKTVLMIDDIIAYGGSLYYSAEELKKNGVNEIYAYATHTENSVLDKEKGTLINVLENNTVRTLFTTNSIFTGKHEKITVMEV